MKHVVILAIALLPINAAAGELVPLADEEGLFTKASGNVLEGTATASGLSADMPALGLQGNAYTDRLTGLSTAGSLSGQGQGTGLTGFVDVPPSPLPPPLPEPVVLPLPEPTRFELHDLHFEYDSAVLSQTEGPMIAELAAIIDRAAPKSVTVIGYTDRRGDSDYNLDLSVRRAQAVLNALVEWHGFNPTLFQVVGRGEKELLSDGLTEADDARDRRVVVVLN
jgi:outer membrane protein OmpA-like peptidoglycan-associated protein